MKTLRDQNNDRCSAIREKVMMLAGISEQQMNCMVFDQAVEYMKSRNMGEEWLTLWLREPLFWSWWRQQWMLVDEVYWHKYSGYMGNDQVKDQLFDAYEAIHRSIDVFPDDIIFDKIHDAYNRSCQQILQKIVNQ